MQTILEGSQVVCGVCREPAQGHGYKAACSRPSPLVDACNAFVRASGLLPSLYYRRAEAHARLSEAIRLNNERPTTANAALVELETNTYYVVLEATRAAEDALRDAQQAVQALSTPAVAA